MELQNYGIILEAVSFDTTIWCWGCYKVVVNIDEFLEANQILIEENFLFLTFSNNA
jgi:hypothetical protein